VGVLEVVVNEYVENSAWQQHGYRHFKNGFIFGCAFVLALMVSVFWIVRWL
jgi:hypothetical protein